MSVKVKMMDGSQNASYFAFDMPLESSVKSLLERVAAQLRLKDVSSLQLRLVAHEGAGQPAKKAEHFRKTVLLEPTFSLSQAGVKDRSWLMVHVTSTSGGGCPN